MRQLTGGAACVTEFNSRLKQDLENIGADTTFTYHCIRGQRIREAGESGLARPSIMHGAGHTTGSHATNYPATDKGWTLGGAGYSVEPEVMAAHVQALYQELNGFAFQVVTKLYEAHRPELLQLEKDAKPGTPLFDWLYMIRHCITAWVVSTCARPRDRFGYILKDLPTKGEIVADEFYSHMQAVDDTEEYEWLMGVVRSIEDTEIARGDLAHRAGLERRVREDIADLKTTLQASSSTVAAQSSSAVAAAASTVSTAIVDAASSTSQIQRCRKCRAKPFIQQLQHSCRRPAEADPVGWSAADRLHGCACHFNASDNSRCREMADALRAGDGDKFMRLYREWDGASEHDECVDQLGTAWLHLAVEQGLITIVDFLLVQSTAMLEAVDLHSGKPIAYAFEQPPVRCRPVDMVAKLLEYGANPTAPCTKSAHHGLGRTPEYLARRLLNADQAEQVIALLRSRTISVPVREGLPSRGSTSSWLPLTQRIVSPASSTALTISSAPAAASSTSLTVSSAPAAASTSSEASLQQQLALAKAQLEACSGSKAKVPQNMPLELKSLQDVPQMMRVWRTIIAPQESKGTSWRSEKTVGGSLHEWAKQLLSHKYYPVLNAVMKHHLDDGMNLDAAVAEVQKLKAPGDWKLISSLPTPDAETKKRYREALLALSPFDASSTPPRSSPEPSATPPSAPLAIAAPPVVPVADGATRYLAFDPSLSCGWAILEVMADQVVSVAVGAIQVDGFDIGSRCNDLQHQMQPLMTPPPASIFVESFYTKGQATDAISISLRAVIAMEANSRDISLVEVAPQSWKSAIGVSGAEKDKAMIKAKLASTFGAAFPAKLPNASSGRLISFKDDASDAAGIALFGAKQRHDPLSFVAPMTISAPSLKPQEAESRGVKRSASGKAKANRSE